MARAIEWVSNAPRIPAPTFGDSQSAQRIAALRAEAGSSTAAIAHDLRISEADYDAIEQGQSRASALILARLSIHHGVPLASFFDSIDPCAGIDKGNGHVATTA